MELADNAAISARVWASPFACVFYELDLRVGEISGKKDSCKLKPHD